MQSGGIRRIEQPEIICRFLMCGFEQIPLGLELNHPPSACRQLPPKEGKPAYR